MKAKALLPLLAGLCVLVLALALNATASFAASATSTVDVCATAAPGQAHCDAVLLTRGGAGKLVRPTVHRVAPERRAHSLTAAVAQAMPLPGSPQWLQQSYDLTALSASRGAGDTVAIVDATGDPNIASDLAEFRSSYGLPACALTNNCLRVVNQLGATAPLPAPDPAWATEETLDVQAVSSICPNCSILLVEANSAATTDLLAAMQTAVNLGANQISVSWSVTAGASPFGSSFLSPATPGGTVPAVFAASGDAGVDPLGQAEYPAALPGVTAVGGTSLNPTNSAAQPRGLSESAWSHAGAGCAVGELGLAHQQVSGCAGRAYSDISAVADPNTGLNVFQAATGGWAVAGGTSLATPIVAAFAAITAVNAQGGPAWAYTEAPALNQPVGGSDGTCSGGLPQVLCAAAGGYSGPTGAGSISGAVVTGAPGIASPTFGAANALGTDVGAVSNSTATLAGGVYPNGEATTYAWQYGATAAYGLTTAAQTIPAGVSPVPASAELTGLAAGTTYHLRLVAVNASGPAAGPDMTFTTGGVRVQAASRRAPHHRSHHARRRHHRGSQGPGAHHRCREAHAGHHHKLRRSPHAHARHGSPSPRL